jgi:fluoride exporter
MLLYVALGSAIGGAARYLLGGLAQRMFETSFPLGTLFINISGSFLLGAIMKYALETPTVSPNLRAFLTIGLCGGYTTFSTFSYESLALMEDGEWTRAGIYVVASVVLALFGTLLGFALVRQALSWR